MRSKDEIIAQEAGSVRPTHILDVGYAQGPNIHLSKVGAVIYGVDLVKWPAPYQQTEVCDLNTQPLPFSADFFDVVTMGCTLAHVAKPLKLLADIHRVLKPDGLLILTSPNPNYYWESIINVFYDYFKHRVSKSKHVEHFFEFPRYAMRTILERSGFSLEKEIGVTFQIVKTRIRINVERWPGLAYEIVYVARKTGKPRGFTIIEDSQGKIINLETNLFS